MKPNDTIPHTDGGVSLRRGGVCPTCGAVAHVNGSNRNGTTRYKCTANPPHYFSESTGRSAGRPQINNPSPAAIKKREQRARKRQQQ